MLIGKKDMTFFENIVSGYRNKKKMERLIVLLELAEEKIVQDKLCGSEISLSLIPC